jgi:hypothetical protein
VPQLARRFQFVEESYEGDARAISCDGLVPGAALDLTHWQNNRTPRQYKADTSTEIAFKFAFSPEALEEWGDAVIVNNHFDTDGLLSAWVLLEPERALDYRELLVAAAEAGDFDEWPKRNRALWLDASIRALGSLAGNDAAAYETLLKHLHLLIIRLETRPDLWQPEWDALQAALADVNSGRLRAWQTDTTGVLVHEPGRPEAPGPLLAREFLPGARRYLLAFERAGGRFDYRYELPRYAWADTVVRPVLPKPDAAGLVQALGREWTDKDLPGMTGVIQTRSPITEDPDTIVERLAELDPS